MEEKNVEKYIGKKVFVILNSGFKYTFDLNKENISGTTISIPEDKFGEPVDFDIKEINLIKFAKENGRGK